MQFSIDRKNSAIKIVWRRSKNRQCQLRFLWKKFKFIYSATRTWDNMEARYRRSK